MASLVTLGSASFACSHVRQNLSFPSNPCLLSISSSPKTANHIKLKHLPRASAEGIPADLIKESKFVPLTTEDPYGPPVLLLLGFEVEEEAKIQELLKGFDGEFLKIIFCTEDMITHTLWEAVNTEQPNLDNVKIAKSVPRICFLSGLTGEEMMMFIDAFPITGLEPALFAGLVPNSADKPIQELIEEIVEDHEMLSANQSS